MELLLVSHSTSIIVTPYNLLCWFNGCYRLMTDGEDFCGCAMNIVFSPGVTQKPVTIKIFDNNILFEEMEEFFGTLTTGDYRVTIFQPHASVRINDVDNV